MTSDNRALNTPHKGSYGIDIAGDYGLSTNWLMTKLLYLHILARIASYINSQWPHDYALSYQTL